MRTETNAEETPRERLKRKIGINFEEYKAGWMKMSSSELIEDCESIQAITCMARVIPCAVSDEDAEYLLRFKNPLEVVSDEWISRNGIEAVIDSLAIDDEVSNMLSALRGQCSAYYFYDSESESSDEEETQLLSM
ncbi:MAG: hypothetical protein IKZ82_08620 [Clostridia bacterium]|nr:hypothetical protein [Clostridia bacterium]